MTSRVRSRRSVYFSVLAIGAIALTSFACGGFDVPTWTRPAGPSSEEDETEPPPETSAKPKTLEDAAGEPPDAQTTTPASDAGDGGDAGPKDAALG